MCLCIVGQAESGYPTVMLSVLNTVVMMVGDMNYMDTFMTPYTDDDPGTLHYGGLAFFILSLFLLLIPILLMNLLVSKSNTTECAYHYALCVLISMYNAGCFVSFSSLVSCCEGELLTYI